MEILTTNYYSLLDLLLWGLLTLAVGVDIGTAFKIKETKTKQKKKRRQKHEGF